MFIEAECPLLSSYDSFSSFGVFCCYNLVSGACDIALNSKRLQIRLFFAFSETNYLPCFTTQVTICKFTCTFVEDSSSVVNHSCKRWLWRKFKIKINAREQAWLPGRPFIWHYTVMGLRRKNASLNGIFPAMKHHKVHFNDVASQITSDI